MFVRRIAARRRSSHGGAPACPNDCAERDQPAKFAIENFTINFKVPLSKRIVRY
jgi:hypothetical protein